MPVEIRFGPQGATFAVKVITGAARTAVAGVWNRSLKIKVAEKPEAGAANRECLRYLAHCLGVPRASVRIIKGEFSRQKVICVQGVSAEDVRKKLLALET
ncbi:DUF167 domain-containing protein [candidate division FCPU426 bacterium]|nr:DUF167 domain-containing protein [candidate division FCPU426 bacterium]